MSYKPSKKILVVGISALVVAIGEAANQLAALYPHNALVNTLPIILPPVLGWLVKEKEADEDVSSQVGVEPTPVEWATVLQTSSPEPISTLPALPNTNVPPQATPAQNASVEAITNVPSDAAVYPPPIAH